LDERGEIDGAFFDLLIAERPRKEAEIKDIQRLWLAVQTPAPPPIPGTRVIPSLETGTVPIGSPFYEPRDSDGRAAAQLDSNNATIVIKGSRQSGKSSLLARLSHAAAERGNRACYLNFRDLGDQDLASTSRLYPKLAWMMVRELGLDVDLDRTWKSLMKQTGNDPRQTLTDLLEDDVLGVRDSHLLLIFDEVDLAFDSPKTRNDLFSMMRSWHERRQRARIESPWKRLQLAIAHATNPALWIKDLRQSPFNVGLQLVLEDFDEGHIADLNQKHGGPLSGPMEVERLRVWTGGHPHLVRIALYTLAPKRRSLDELERHACDQGSPFADHLNDCLFVVKRDRVLTKEVRSILKQEGCSNDEVFQKLWAAGLIQGPSPRAATMRCRLYREFFGSRL
jgi:hypothetical protein